MRQAQRDAPEAPQQRGQQELQDRAQEHHLEAGKAPGTQLAPQQDRIAHVDRPGHHVALDPARALLDPGDHPAVRLFGGDGVDQFGPVAVAEEAHAQVGVLGDVVGIPAAQFLDHRAAEEQRGAAQRNGQAQALDAGQHQPEPGGIFDGEAARQPVGAGVVVIQHALQAGDFGAAAVEAVDDLADLAGFGGILGIIDADDRAAAMVERQVQGAGLGLDPALGHRHHPHPGRQCSRGQGGAGHGILGLDGQHHIKQFARVVQPRQPAHQAGRDVAFAVERHDDRHLRQARDGGRRGRGRRFAHRGQAGGQLQRAGQRQRHQRHPQHQLRHQARGDPQHGQRQQPEEYQRRQPFGPAPDAAAFGLGHPGFGEAGQAVAAPGVDGGFDLSGGRDGHQYRAEGGLEPVAVAG